MRFRLNRRAFLRSVTQGVAAGMALPVLECMVDSKGRFFHVAHAANVAAPVRYLGFMIQNGVPPSLWNPVKNPDGSMGLNTAMSSLAHLQGDLNQIVGLDASFLRNSNAGNEHWNGQFGFWTGRRMSDDSQGQGPSVEQLLGQKLGQGVTKFPSLAVSLPRGFSDRNDQTGKNTWINARQPGSYLWTPKALSDKLFGGLSASPSKTQDPADKRNQSILNQYMTDIKSLQAKLSMQDRARLDQHLSTVEEIESGLRVVNNACTPLAGTYPDVGYGGGDWTSQKAVTLAAMPVMMKLVVFAFQCDLTRYVLFEVANAPPKDATLIPADDDLKNPSMNDHYWSHRFNSDTDNMNAYYFDQKMRYWSTFLDAMKASTEADKNILYNSICLLGSDVGYGMPHWMYNYPVVQVGQAGGRIKTGQILQAAGFQQEAPSGTSLNNLHATLLTAAGLPTNSFGDQSSGRFPGLLT